MENPKMIVFKRKEESTKELLVECDKYSLANDGGNPDLEFMCRDGKVPAHQFMLAGHSEFLRTLFYRFQDVEFSIGDWATGQMFLLDRRKGNEVLKISVPDLESKQIKMMLDLFYRGSISLSGPDEAKVLRDIWKVFRIDSVRLDSLDVISEVILNNSHVDRNSANYINSHHDKIANIKTEIIDEVDELIDLKSSLEVQCNDCKERFREEEDLLRHMDHIHGTSRSMYDRIKYKRAKDGDGNSSHPKSKKGKGKGKKSIQSKPLRKDNETNSNDESAQDTPKKDEPEAAVEESRRNSIDDLIASQDSVDESSRQSTDTEKPTEPQKGEQEKSIDESDNSKCSTENDEDETDENKIEENKTDEKKTDENIRVENKTDEIKKDEIKKDENKKEERNKREENIGEKRTIEHVEKTIEEPSPKRTRRELKDQTPEKPPEPEPESEDEDEESWEDIQCLYCEQDVPVFKNKPGQNRKKYQQHLLTHFLDQQYAEIPEGLRVYQCSYKGCPYGAGSKNPYIQHIAFKHDEWFKRINRRIEQAMNDPEIGDELEELSAVKEVFVTDYRIMPIPKGSSNVKPLWVDGQATGRDAENEIIPPPKEAKEDKNISSSSDEEKPKQKENKKTMKIYSPRSDDSKSDSNSPTHDEVFETILKSQKSLTNVETPETTPKKEEPKPKLKLNSILPIMPPIPKSSDEEMETETIVTFTGTLLDDPKAELRCQFCTKVMKIDPSKTHKNRQSYQIHLMESHFERSMYSDIPSLDKYFCPYKGCDYSGTDLKARFRIHLAFRHKEFAKRINRRINELDRTTPSFEKSGELHNLRDLREFFKNDPRVVNIAKTDAENWIKDDILFSSEVIAKAGPPIKSKSTSPQGSSGANTPIFQTPDGKMLVVEKQETDIPEIKVEISEELIKQLKHEPIKLEPVDLSDSPMSKDGEQEEETMPLISLKVSEEDSNQKGKEKVSRNLDLKKDDIIEPEKEKPSIKDENNPSDKPKLALSKGKGKKSKKEVKTQNLRKDPRPDSPNQSEENHKSDEDAQKKETQKNDKRKLEKWDVKPSKKDEKSKTENQELKTESADDSYDEMKEIKEALDKQKKEAANDSVSVVTVLPLMNDEPKETIFNEKTGMLESPKILTLVESPVSENENIMNVPEPPPIEAKTDTEDTPVKRSSDSPSLSLIPSDDSESSGSKVIENTQNPEIYSCKTCKKDFDKRPGVIMHIITQHMQERFGDVPHLIEEKYKCHHNECIYSSTKRNGLLAHLTLKHNAIKITDVTDLIIHNDEQLLRAVKTEPRTTSLSSESHHSTSEAVDKIKSAEAVPLLAKQIKLECIDKPLPVRINKKDQAHISWKCKECEKNFVSEDGVRQHILLTHLLDQFDEIAPRGLKIYSCKQCFKYSTVSRTNFIKHLGMLHQVVHEETVGQYVEQSKSLLLDIDVIKCRCDKQFDKQRQLKDHIVFSHYKHKFKQIPKGKDSYKCREYQCFFTTESRVLLIKHLVTTHKTVTEKDINKFIPSNPDSQSSDSSSSEDSLGQDDSSIDFNDSVSQAQTPKHVNEMEANTIVSQSDALAPSLAEMPFANNLSHKCPICSKVIAQRSNFEDHLQTHGIQHEAVFHCVDCEFATSFAQMYYHLSSFHKKSGQIDLQCLSCEDNFNSFGYQDAIQHIRDHCTNKVSKSTHQFNAKRYITNAQQTLYFVFRYSCQLCSMYFKTTDALSEHGKKFNARCFHMNHGVRFDPVYTCHLCDFSKASSLFGHHCQGIQHQHKVSAEAATHKEKYGVSSKDHFYSCENCLMASSLENTIGHLKDDPGKCLHMMCGPCGLDVESEDSQGLTNYLQQHVLSDQHTDRVAKFRQNSTSMVPAYVLKYRFCCESCSASFTTYNSLSSHNNCPRSRFRCVPCNFDSTSSEFTQHLRTTTHARAVATRPSVSSSSESSSVSTVNHVSDPENDIAAVVDITNSPPSVDIADSPPRVEIPETSSFRLPKPAPFRQPVLPAGITMRPVSPDESIMEVKQSRSFNKLPRQRPRIPSPTESIMEVDPTRAPSPTPSIMEIDTIPDTHQMNTPVEDPIQPVRARLVSNHRMRSPMTHNLNSNHRNPSTPSPSNINRNARMINSPAAAIGTPPGTSRQRIVTVAPPPKFSNFKVSQPKPSTSMGRPIQAGRVSSGLTPLYSCGEPCKLSFSDTQKFQNHSIWHDSTKTYAKLDCHVCGWHIAGESVSDAVTMHLFNIKHTVNVAKKMSKSVK